MQIIKNKRVKYYIDLWNNSGRCAWYHPRKKTVSLNGAPTIPQEEAIKRIKDLLKV